MIKPRFEQLNNNCVIASTKKFISFKLEWCICNKEEENLRIVLKENKKECKISNKLNVVKKLKIVIRMWIRKMILISVLDDMNDDEFNKFLENVGSRIFSDEKKYAKIINNSQLVLKSYIQDDVYKFIL